MEVDVVILWRKILSDYTIKFVFLLVSTVILHNIVFFGLFQGIVIFFSFLIGFYCCRNLFHWILLICETPSIQSTAATYHSKKQIGEKPSNVSIPSSVDRALDQLFCRILNQYILSWYCNISSDYWFQYEVRLTIRDIIAIMYERASRLKMDHFILNKIIPICLNHFMTSAKFKNIQDKQNYTQYLHVAVHSRKSEILYVQNLSTCLLKYLLPKSILNCKSYSILLREISSKSLFLSLSDAVCNPSVLNYLILRYLDEKNWACKDDKSIDSTLVVDQVDLLQNFVDSFKCSTCYSSLRPDVNTILKDEELQNTFMHYLRGLNAEHILQFCLDATSFNEKLLKPDLEAQELDDLFRDAWDLFSVYFSSHSPNCIDFKKDLASPLRKALSKDVLKLRTTATLFEAHDYAFSLLEDFCEDFYNSAEFYYWLYGRCNCNDSAQTEDNNKACIHENSGTKENAGLKTIFEISDKLHKIKDVLKPDPILEGGLYELPGQIESDDGYTVEMGVDANIASTLEERNINRWQISIPTVGSRLDPITNKAYSFFVVHVNAEDGTNWSVERRPADLFTLDYKLTEFHGNLADAQLPPKRMLTARSESVQLYEEYLNKLMKNSDLKSSELLHKFLTSKNDFEEEEEENSFGKMLRKSMVPTLRKERGQNLESFVQSLIASCKTTNYEWKEISEEKSTKKPHSNAGLNYLYDNNFDISPDETKSVLLIKKPTQLCSRQYTTFSFFIYAAFHIYEIRTGFIRLLLALQCVIGKLFDRIILAITNSYLQRIVKPYNIAYFINIIQWAIFDNGIKNDDNENNKRKVEELLNDMKCSWLHPVYALIFENLQDPKNNKQLYYNLLDAVVEELFPEMNTAILEE